MHQTWMSPSHERNSHHAADDQLLVRQGMRALLSTMPQYEVIAECADGFSAVETSRRLQPDVVILDIDMPGISGIDAAKQIHTSNPGIEILIPSAIDRREMIVQALEAGVSGYLHRFHPGRAAFCPRHHPCRQSLPVAAHPGIR